MRKDIFNEVKRQMSNDIKVNCAEVARRFNCDPRTVKRYVDGACESRKKSERNSILEEYKEIVIDKIDNFGATAKAAYQPSINKKEIQDLATLRFIEMNQNVLFVGSP